MGLGRQHSAEFSVSNIESRRARLGSGDAPSDWAALLERHVNANGDRSTQP